MTAPTPKRTDREDCDHRANLARHERNMQRDHQLALAEQETSRVRAKWKRIAEATVWSVFWLCLFGYLTVDVLT